MNQKKVYKRKTKTRKVTILLASLIMVLAVGVSGTIAYLIAHTDPVTNTFTIGTAPPHIVEEFDGTTKEYVQVKNEGTVDAYIRAKVVVTWQKADGTVSGQKPVLETDYTMTIPGTNWELGDDGCYYYTKIVPAGTTIEDALLTNGEVLETANNPDESNYSLSIEILAQSIQAEGKDSEDRKPVIIAWGTETAGGPGGSVKSVENDTLVIQAPVTTQ